MTLSPGVGHRRSPAGVRFAPPRRLLL